MTKTVKIGDVKEAELLKYIKEGKVIIYPTDTIYGIGCDAKNTAAVQKIRGLKGRTGKPFSVIAPSKEWVYENFEIRNKNYIEKLPGPYTFVLKMKRAGVVSYHASSSTMLGVRIPDHEITRMIQKARTPFVTTSVSMQGEQPATEVKKIPKKMVNSADLVIDAGVLSNQASVLIDLTGETPRIIRRT